MRDNGGPAFPVVVDFNPCSGKYESTSMDGMTLRDYFAAQALAGLLANQYLRRTAAIIVAVECYEFADAMLKEREK